MRPGMAGLRCPFRVNFDPSVTFTGVTLKPMCCVRCWDLGQVKRTMGPTLIQPRVPCGMPIFSAQGRRHG